MRVPRAASLLGFACTVLTSPLDRFEHISFQPLIRVSSDSLHNIHITFPNPSFTGSLAVVYGDCNTASVYDHHHSIGRTEIRDVTSQPKRLVWIVPENVEQGGCLHAFSGEELVGRSGKVVVEAQLKKRQKIAEVADISGPWFDGIAYLKNKNNTSAFVTEAKNKKIAIIGGGMAGLLTSLLLQSVGIKNWEIMESSQRIGGRVRTKYLNGTTPDQYQYQEMGPMRFPESITYPDTGETIAINDHQMVFQLADVLNQLNGNSSSLKINFIPWIQSSPNTPANSRGVRLPNGQIPSASQIRANSSLIGPAQTPSNATEAAAASKAVDDFEDLDRDKVRELATNIYKAHKQAIEDGLFDWSVANYLRYKLGISLNVTDFLAGAGGGPLWLYDSVYFRATKWRTIDKGLESLPRAFLPHVQNKTTFGRFVSGLTYIKETDKIAVNWRDEEDRLSLKPKSAEFDYAIVAVPFTKVRIWRNPPYSSLLSRAISTMNYRPSCKVALHYKTRFWESLSPPINGGCGAVDIPGIGTLCYPPYKINSTGPGVVLASYNSGSTISYTVESLSDADHIALVQRSMIEIHGQIAAEQWTGNYDRQCWGTDQHQAGAWADPLVGQQELYLPAYYQTEFKTIFIGEHTSYTHSWIFSALDSAVRGTAQLLLDMGLVDEAKTVVNTWMGRWITI